LFGILLYIDFVFYRKRLCVYEKDATTFKRHVLKTKDGAGMVLKSTLTISETNCVF